VHAQAFHFGTRFLVEIDVVLPPTMVRDRAPPRLSPPPYADTDRRRRRPPHPHHPLPHTHTYTHAHTHTHTQLLQEAHDIGESLQKKVESLEEVERAFVHLDFETSHNPTSEHKQWGNSGQG
jgi:hypothetical protein